MINKEILSFLEDLQCNNNRDWFNNNKETYLKVKSIFDEYIRDLIQHLAVIEPEIIALEPKDCVFRIYKDTRFSKDKIPYKTHFGAYIAKGGRKSPFAGYYIHVERGRSFIGGGVHSPENHILKSIRTEIYENSEQFKAIIHKPEFQEHFKLYGGNALKTAPKGFSKDWPDIELLRNKSFAFVKEIPDEQLIDMDFNSGLLDYFALLKPINDWLNRVIADAVN